MKSRQKIIRALVFVAAVCVLSLAVVSCGGTGQATPPGATGTVTPTASPAATGTPSPTETAAATATPQATPTETATETAPAGQNLEAVDFENLHFTYDAGVLGGFDPRAVAEEKPENAPAFAVTPKHIEVGFPNFPAQGNAFGPTVRVYRLSDYQPVDPQLVGRQVDYLKTLLESRPDLSQVFPLSGVLQPSQSAQFGPEPPFLPLVNAASDLRVKMDYIDFQNGSGIRYVTRFSQAPTPIDKKDIFYTYQGITSDGLYWVSVTFPVGTSAVYPVPPAGWENDVQKALSFNAEVASMYDKMDPALYIPSLQTMDELIKSIKIDVAQ